MSPHDCPGSLPTEISFLQCRELEYKQSTAALVNWGDRNHSLVQLKQLVSAGQGTREKGAGYWGGGKAKVYMRVPLEVLGWRLDCTCTRRDCMRLSSNHEVDKGTKVCYINQCRGILEARPNKSGEVTLIPH